MISEKPLRLILWELITTTVSLDPPRRTPTFVWGDTAARRCGAEWAAPVCCSPVSLPTPLWFAKHHFAAPAGQRARAQALPGACGPALGYPAASGRVLAAAALRLVHPRGWCVVPDGLREGRRGRRGPAAHCVLRFARWELGEVTAWSWPGPRRQLHGQHAYWKWVARAAWFPTTAYITKQVAVSGNHIHTRRASPGYLSIPKSISVTF